MRLCLPARMGGGGKAESLPWSGPAGEARHTGATILLRETRGQSPWRSRLSNERRRSASLSRSAAQATAPLHGVTPTGDVTASRAKTRPLRHRRSAASQSECAAGARTARREAGVPAGQPKDSAPSRSVAGKSAALEDPAHFPRSRSTPEGPRLQAWSAIADRAGRRQAAQKARKRRLTFGK